MNYSLFSGSSFFAALGTMANLLIMHWRTTLDQLLPNTGGSGAGQWRAQRQHLKKFNMLQCH